MLLGVYSASTDSFETKALNRTNLRCFPLMMDTGLPLLSIIQQETMTQKYGGPQPETGEVLDRLHGREERPLHRTTVELCQHPAADLLRSSSRQASWRCLREGTQCDESQQCQHARN